MAGRPAMTRGSLPSVTSAQVPSRRSTHSCSNPWPLECWLICSACPCMIGVISLSLLFDRSAPSPRARIWPEDFQSLGISARESCSGKASASVGRSEEASSGKRFSGNGSDQPGGFSPCAVAGSPPAKREEKAGDGQGQQGEEEAEKPSQQDRPDGWEKAASHQAAEDSKRKQARQETKGDVRFQGCPIRRPAPAEQEQAGHQGGQEDGRQLVATAQLEQDPGQGGENPQYAGDAKAERGIPAQEKVGKEAQRDVDQGRAMAESEGLHDPGETEGASPRSGEEPAKGSQEGNPCSSISQTDPGQGDYPPGAGSACMGQVEAGLQEEKGIGHCRTRRDQSQLRAERVVRTTTPGSTITRRSTIQGNPLTEAPLCFAISSRDIATYCTWPNCSNINLPGTIELPPAVKLPAAKVR